MSEFDLVEELRKHARNELVSGATADWLDSASHEITRLRKQLADRDAQWERAIRETLVAEYGCNHPYPPDLIAAIRERLKEQDNDRVLD